MANNNASILIKQQKELEKTLLDFVTVIEVEAKNHYVKSFQNQGFTDSSLQRWTPRRNEIIGGIAKLKSSEKGSRAILVKSGDLRRSIKVFNRNKYSITFGSDLPYSSIHNNGGYGLAYGKHSFKMPKRQFIGHSSYLNKKLIEKLRLRVNRVFR
jgi:phage gpG-like protein